TLSHIPLLSLPHLLIPSFSLSPSPSPFLVSMLLQPSRIRSALLNAIFGAAAAAAVIAVPRGRGYDDDAGGYGNDDHGPTSSNPSPTSSSSNTTVGASSLDGFGLNGDSACPGSQVSPAPSPFSWPIQFPPSPALSAGHLY
ncbi:MAG TPA: hypothetical protein VGO47_07265, partial [Chlamydiales bacterium]|nr:hypothetical protein [Chlamydiales bacterium]